MALGIAACAGAIASSVLAGSSPAPCCPADLSGDGLVSGADLTVVLGLWGAPGAADLDKSGVADGGDLAIVLGDWGFCPAKCLQTLVAGTVEFKDGTPVDGAVVVTSLGGTGVSASDGGFAFPVEVEPTSGSLVVTAVVSVRGETYSGARKVESIALGGVTDAGTIVVLPKTPCNPAWLPSFGGTQGTSGTVRAFEVYDDGRGDGPSLYVAGTFLVAGGTTVNRVARWDGHAWHALEGGVTGGLVYDLEVFDDGLGGGPELYAAGTFTHVAGVPSARIAKWNGRSWSPLAVPVTTGNGDDVYALQVFDDGRGGGPALFAGGLFDLGAGVGEFIARWDGRAWSQLGPGLNNTVTDLVTFDDGGGEALYAAGAFTAAGATSVNRVAKWDGTSWTPLGTGVGATAQSLAVFDDGRGGGPALYLGGAFSTAGGVSVNRVARWNGSAWSALGQGVNASMLSLEVFDDGRGDGPALYAGGSFTSASGVPASRVAKWNGSSWSPLGGGVDNSVQALAAFDDSSGAGPRLFVGGDLMSSDGIATSRISAWNGATWGVLGEGLDGLVRALVVHDDGSGSGPALFAGGSFKRANGVLLNGVAKWSGASWSPLGTGMSDPVRALAVFDDGSGRGPVLVAGGEFTTADGDPANRIAQWDGASWTPLGTGMSGGLTPFVNALIVFDDGEGAGPALYAGGAFLFANGLPANRVAKWNGESWSALGSGVGGAGTEVLAFAVHDADPDAPILLVGGSFTSAGGSSANRIASWNGTGWSPLGGGVGGTTPAVHAIALFDDDLGGGPAVFAAGSFTTAGGGAANRIAKWNGAVWSPLGSGVGSTAYALSIFDDGSGDGSALFVGGAFQTAGGNPAPRIAKWDGAVWSPLAGGVSGTVRALTVFERARGVMMGLCVGGEFVESPAGDSFVSGWGCAP